MATRLSLFFYGIAAKTLTLHAVAKNGTATDHAATAGTIYSSIDFITTSHSVYYLTEALILTPKAWPRTY